MLVADVIGPEARSVDGDKFAVVVKDIASGVVMCEPLRNKSSVLIMGTILMFQGWLRGARPGNWIPDEERGSWALHTDGGGEFTADATQLMLLRAGGQHYLSTAYRHSGRAEAAVKQMRHALLKS